MTYEEHIEKAEELLAGPYDSVGPLGKPCLEAVAKAQVHATLALAKKLEPVVELDEAPREPWHAFLTGRWSR
jgi:hypothetical protein